ncbi:MAG: hypothetical protein JW850_17640 [Thermoflexales bacterium]|nr:hypothetical protein [Thermoflexales bacterium]
MSGVAGIAGKGKQVLINRMLDKTAHRGSAGQQIVEIEGNTLGIAWAQAQVVNSQLTLLRGPLGDE